MTQAKNQQIKSDRLKLFLSLFWFLFTFSMVLWWWIFSLRQLDVLADEISKEKYERLRWMLLWEGSSLLAFILVGGAALLILTNRERMRNLRLRLFFSNFSHDLKTSLSRLRIRTEVLAQSHNSQELQELLAEASRLDLQLENSLWVARGEEQKLDLKEMSLSEVIGRLRVEWPDLEIHLHRNAKVIADPLALRSILRNIFQNSWLHGQANRIEIRVESPKANRVKLLIEDNGKGFQGNIASLGRELKPGKDYEGNGIGLFLSRFLVSRMKGQLDFHQSEKGFGVSLIMEGSLT